MSDTPTPGQCPCGRPAPTTNLCSDCTGALRRNLHRIADRWAELEDALTWRETFGGIIAATDDGPSDTAHGERKLPISTGTTINEPAVKARRAAFVAAWFALQVIRDEFDQRGWGFDPPRLKGGISQDDTPAIARWIAARHVDYLATKADPNSAHEITADIAKAEGLVYRATHPTGIHWAPVNLTCDQWTTSAQGERVPCPGDMWAQVGRDVMPDLVCNHDESHSIDPQVWERSGWKRRLRMPLDPTGVAALSRRLADGRS